MDQKLSNINLFQEYKLFLKWIIKNPLYIFHIFLFVLNKIHFKFKKNKKNSLAFYPRSLQKLIPSFGDYVWPQIDNNKRNLKIDDNIIEINFAGVIQIYRLIDNIDFSQDFEDSEVNESLHRFFWLKHLSLNEKWALEQIELWHQFYRSDFHDFSKKKNARWESYTLSERLINIINFLNRIQIPPSRFTQVSIYFQFQYLHFHLEIHNPYTGNHIINNARAIFYGGHFFKSEKSILFSETIINHYLKQLLGEDFLLNEGSVHYSFLFFSWLQEIEAFVINDDLKNEIRKILSKMKISLENLLVTDSCFPLIGDISPDISPRELLRQIGLSSNPISKESGDIKRFDSSDFSIFYRTKNLCQISRVGHFHQDLLHIVLYFKQIPIFIDCGRKCYHTVPIDHDPVRAWGHNSVIIKNREVLPYPFLKFPHQYSTGVFKAHTREDGLLFQTNHFDRQASKNFFERRITVNNCYLEIVDQYVENEIFDIFSFFHVSPIFNEIVKDQSMILLKSEKLDLIVTSDSDELTQDDFYHSEEYGHLKQHTRLCLKSRNRSHKIKIEIKNVRN
jgi:hypothetical protein